MDSPHFTTAAAAAYLRERGHRVTVNTMNYWRSVGRGPAYEKRGVAIVYTKPGLDAYDEASTIRVDPQGISEPLEAAE